MPSSPKNTPWAGDEKLRILVDAIPALISYVDAQRRYRFNNRAYEQWFGRSSDNVYGKLIWEVIGQAAYEAIAGYVDEALAGRPVTFESFVPNKDGVRRWVRANFIPDLGADGKAAGFFVLVNDLTERKNAEDSLREREEYLAGLTEILGDGIFSVRMPERQIEYVNRAAAEMFGYRPDEMIGQETRILYEDDAHYESFGRLLGEALARKETSVQAEMELQRKDGSLFWAEVSTNFLIVSNAPWIVISLVRDITERKQAEREKEHTNHLLGERIKELSTLHGASEILESQEKPIADVMRELVAILPPGWQYPQVTAARIVFGEVEYTTPNFVPAPWKQSAGFRTFDGKTGLLEVVYLEERPLEAEGPFLLEERNLINTLAEMLQTYLERRRAKEQIQCQLERLTALHTIDTTITSSLDLHYTLGVILGQVMAQLRVDSADVLLINGQTQMLEFAVGRGFRSADIQRADQQLGQGHAGRAALQRKTVHAVDLKKADGEFAGKLAGEEFVDYYSSPLIAKGQVKGVLEVFHRAAINPDSEWLAFLEALATQTAIAIDNIELFNGLQSSNLQLTMTYETTLEGWVYALDLRDKETEGHTQRVTQKTMQLARAMGLTEEKLVHLRRGALLHDIGKLGIPDSILLKPGPLTEDEWVVMRRHPIYAYEWLSPISYLRPALEIPYCHHERWDGSGYPRGLKAEEIPLAARLFTVVDVWDALRSHRSYRPAWAEEKVRDYIRSLAEIYFDPQVVDMFLRIVDEEK